MLFNVIIQIFLILKYTMNLKQDFETRGSNVLFTIKNSVKYYRDDNNSYILSYIYMLKWLENKETIKNLIEEHILSIKFYERFNSKKAFFNLWKNISRIQTKYFEDYYSNNVGIKRNRNLENRYFEYIYKLLKNPKDQKNRLIRKLNNLIQHKKIYSELNKNIEKLFLYKYYEYIFTVKDCEKNRILDLIVTKFYEDRYKTHINLNAYKRTLSHKKAIVHIDKFDISYISSVISKFKDSFIGYKDDVEVIYMVFYLDQYFLKNSIKEMKNIGVENFFKKQFYDKIVYNFLKDENGSDLFPKRKICKCYKNIEIKSFLVFDIPNFINYLNGISFVLSFPENKDFSNYKIERSRLKRCINKCFHDLERLVSDFLSEDSLAQDININT